VGGRAPQLPVAFHATINITAHHVDRTKPYPPWLKVCPSHPFPPLRPTPRGGSLSKAADWAGWPCGHAPSPVPHQWRLSSCHDAAPNSLLTESYAPASAELGGVLRPAQQTLPCRVFAHSALCDKALRSGACAPLETRAPHEEGFVAGVTTLRGGCSTATSRLHRCIVSCRKPPARSLMF
jgi:hypothetical protein